MAKNTRLADFIVDGQADLLAAALKDGFIDIYDGVQPDSIAQQVAKHVLCVSLRFGSPAFSPAVKGIISAMPIASGVAAADVKQASWARCFKADHKTAVMDVSVGTSDANLILPTTHIVRGVTVSISTFLHSVPMSTPGV